MSAAATIPARAPRELDRATLARGVAALARSDDDLAAIVRDHGLPPLWARRPGYAALVRMVLEQQVSLASAAATYARIGAVCGRVVPGRILDVGEPRLRRAGVTRQKARYCVTIAEAVTSGEVDLPALRHASEDEVRASLMRIVGIGRWTADVYLLMALRRPDVWPVGDLALDRELALLDTRRREPPPPEAWRPWRSVAARLLWHRTLCRRR